MDVDVVSSIVIARPRAEVAAFAMDPDHATQWYENIRSVEWVGARRLGQGARVAFVASFLGRRLAYTYELVEWVEGERLVMRTAEGPFPMETTYSFEDHPTGTTMTLRNRGTPSGFSRWLAPLMVPAMRRANRKDLEALARALGGR